MSLVDINILTPSWLDGAVCASVDPALFYPDKGGSPQPAKSVCAVCPVTTACLAWAVSNGLREGIFGGLTARERRGMKAAA